MTTTLAERQQAGVPTRDTLLATARKLGPMIREHADEAERGRRLSPVVIGALKENGLFRLLLPRSLGGLEVDPVTCSLERHFRDAQTLRHHGFMSGNRFEAVGQVYCGVDPEFPMVAF
jgi:alkylation response protein AidB-like acyl-CoA dehydrogenase